VLFRRVRSVLIRAHGEGLIAHTLNFDYEVRSAEEAFGELPDALLIAAAVGGCSPVSRERIDADA
jgi:non-homologous end joining protein Ku